MSFSIFRYLRKYNDVKNVVTLNIYIDCVKIKWVKQGTVYKGQRCFQSYQLPKQG